MRIPWVLGGLLLIVLTSACTLTGQNITPEPLASPTPVITGVPQVEIVSPESGDEITVGERVLVSATATDAGGITQVQLFANGTLVKTQPAPDDDNLNVSVVLDYETRTAGELELEVLAYRGTVASDPAAVTINVVEENTGAGGTTTGGSTTGGTTTGGSGPVIDPNDPTCRIFTNVGLNYRTGPSTDYDRLGTFPAGSQRPIVGRLGDNSWWLVQANSFTQAWVSSEFTTEYGICSNVPIVLPPPTPTSTAPTPTPTPTPTERPTETPVPTDTPIPGPPDLVITSIAGPQALDGDTSATYTVQITNTGQSEAGEFANSVRFLPGGDVQELGAVSGLGPNQSVVLQITLNFPGEGEFTVQATADSDNAIEELSEVNNTGSYIVNVTVGDILGSSE